MRLVAKAITFSSPSKLSHLNEPLFLTTCLTDIKAKQAFVNKRSYNKGHPPAETGVFVTRRKGLPNLLKDNYKTDRNRAHY